MFKIEQKFKMFKRNLIYIIIVILFETTKTKFPF